MLQRKSFNLPGIPVICYFIVLFAGASYIYIYFFSMLWFVFIRCRETGDFTAAAVVFSIGTNSETCGTKLLFMVIYKYVSLAFNLFCS